jgi:hypothetical protein
MYQDLEFSYWLADKSGFVHIGEYMWKQGCHLDRFITTTREFSAKEFTHIMRLVFPKHPTQGE